jgi:hypothetical protein
MKLHRLTAAAFLSGAFVIASISPLHAQSAPSGAASTGSPVAAGPNPQVPQPEDQSGVNWKGVGVGAGTVLGNAVYMPAKLVYGILGGIAGGAGWALTGGNTQIADTIWRSSLGGDYVLTPSMVAGKQPIHFSGPTATAPPPTADQTANPAANATVAQSGASVNAGSPTQPTITSGPHPIDNGAGPVSGGGNATPTNPPAPLPSTNIE